MKLQIKRLTKTAITPEYQTAGAACFDLHADGVQNTPPLQPNSNRIVNTGLAVKVPEGYALFIFSRSGHGFKNNVALSNCVGVVDSDYVGEIKIALSNHGNDNFVFRQGDRIAQGLVLPVERVVFEEVEELPDTVRGAGGFGV